MKCTAVSAVSSRAGSRSSDTLNAPASASTRAAASQRTERQTLSAQEARTDSLQLTEVRRTRTLPLPPDTVRMEIPAARLADLPPGASFHKRSGRASAGVSRKGDTLLVYASCDSLQALCHYYERTSASWRQRYGEMEGLYKEERERRSKPVRTFFAGFAAGALLSVLTTVFIIKKRKKNG